MIWLGSDVKPNNIKARVQKGGKQVTVLTKMPPELLSTESYLKTYSDTSGRPMFSKTDVRVIAHATAVSNLKMEMNEDYSEDLWSKMLINLPFQVEEQFYNDGVVPGYKLTKVNGKLIMYLELIGVQSNYNDQYQAKTFDEKNFELQDNNSNKQPGASSHQQTNPNQPQQETQETYLKRLEEQIRVKKLELEAMKMREEAEKIARDTFARMNQTTTNKSPSLSPPHTNTDAAIEKNSPSKPAAKDVSPDALDNQLDELIAFAQFATKSPSKRQRLNPFS